MDDNNPLLYKTKYEGIYRQKREINSHDYWISRKWGFEARYALFDDDGIPISLTIEQYKFLSNIVRHGDLSWNELSELPSDLADLYWRFMLQYQDNVNTKSRADRKKTFEWQRKAIDYSLNYFVTCTWADQLTTEQNFSKDFEYLINYASRQELRFIAIRERGKKRQRLHYHFLCDEHTLPYILKIQRKHAVELPNDCIVCDVHTVYYFNQYLAKKDVERVVVTRNMPRKFVALSEAYQEVSENIYLEVKNNGKSKTDDTV